MLTISVILSATLKQVDAIMLYLDFTSNRIQEITICESNIEDVRTFYIIRFIVTVNCGYGYLFFRLLY